MARKISSLAIIFFFVLSSVSPLHAQTAIVLTDNQLDQIHAGGLNFNDFASFLGAMPTRTGDHANTPITNTPLGNITLSPSSNVRIIKPFEILAPTAPAVPQTSPNIESPFKPITPTLPTEVTSPITSPDSFESLTSDFSIPASSMDNPFITGPNEPTNLSEPIEIPGGAVLPVNNTPNISESGIPSDTMLASGLPGDLSMSSGLDNISLNISDPSQTASYPTTPLQIIDSPSLSSELQGSPLPQNGPSAMTQSPSTESFNVNVALTQPEQNPVIVQSLSSLPADLIAQSAAVTEMADLPSNSFASIASIATQESAAATSSLTAITELTGSSQASLNAPVETAPLAMIEVSPSTAFSNPSTPEAPLAPAAAVAPTGPASPSSAALNEVAKQGYELNVLAGSNGKDFYVSASDNSGSGNLNPTSFQSNSFGTNILNVTDSSQAGMSTLVNVNAAGSVVPVQLNLVVVMNSTIENLNNLNSLNLQNMMTLQVK